MSKKILTLIAILPLIIIFIVYGIEKGIKLEVDVLVEQMVLEHESVEELVMTSDNDLKKLSVNLYPKLAINSQVKWRVEIIEKFDDDPTAPAEIVMIDDEPYLKGHRLCIARVIATLYDDSMSQEFTVYIIPEGDDVQFVDVIQPASIQSLMTTYCYGMKCFANGEVTSDAISIKTRVFPSSSSQNVTYSVNSAEVTVNSQNELVFLKPGQTKVTIHVADNPSVKREITYQVIDGVNIYNYQDLLLATNDSETGQTLVMQTNLESSDNLLAILNTGSASDPVSIAQLTTSDFTKLAEKGYALAGQVVNGAIVMDYLEYESTYDTLFYTNYGMDVPKLKVGINFKGDVYGNGYTINLHELTYPTEIQAGTKKPVPSSTDLFNGPLMFISAGGLTVWGQDNIGFMVSKSDALIQNINLRNCNSVSDLTYLDYVGTTLEVVADNVTLDHSTIQNGRTVVRSFSSLNLTINACLLRNAREFIFKIGSNSILRASDIDHLSPTPVDGDNKVLSDSSATIKNTFFETSGVFCIGLDTHFAGALLYDGTKYIAAAHDLAATSYKSVITINGDVRFYDWKKIAELDSSTLMTGYNDSVSFDIASMIETVAQNKNIIKTNNGEKYVHGGIAFFGGGLNLSEIRFTNFDESEMVYLEVDLADSRLQLSSIMTQAAGTHPFKFYLYPNTYSDITIDSTANWRELASFE